VRSFDDSSGSTVAIARTREDDSTEGAEIIDLVQLPAGARPHPRAELDYEEVLEARALDCECYAACLAFAAHVHWRGFHCRRCPKLAARAERADNPAATPAAVIRLR
jgi:hypothetical protein